MKAWHRIGIGVLVGLAIGTGAAVWKTAQVQKQGGLTNHIWTTNLTTGSKAADRFTRARVAIWGLLALPATETVYWAAKTDSDGKILDGGCTYTMTGGMIDARWWSITSYNQAGYLVPNPARIWSFSSAALTDEQKAGWGVTLAPVKPATGYWLPGTRGQPFELTLRMYNPGPAFRAAPTGAEMPMIHKEHC